MKTATILFKVSPELKKALSDYAHEKDLSMAAVIRKAVVEYMKKDK